MIDVTEMQTSQEARDIKRKIIIEHAIANSKTPAEAYKKVRAELRHLPVWKEVGV